MIKFSKTKLEGVLLIKQQPYEDFRGEYLEIYNEKNYLSEIANNLKGTFYEKQASSLHFIEDDISTGNKSVLKGIHGDTKTWKMVQCLLKNWQINIQMAD